MKYRPHSNPIFTLARLVLTLAFLFNFNQLLANSSSLNICQNFLSDPFPEYYFISADNHTVFMNLLNNIDDGPKVKVIRDSLTRGMDSLEDFYTELDTLTSKSQTLIRAEQRQLIKWVEDLKAKWSAQDLVLLEQPYTFAELDSRSFPVYRQQKAGESGTIPNTIIGHNGLAGLYIKSGQALAMDTWNPLRFPKKFAMVTDQVVLTSNASAREKLLDPAKRALIYYYPVQIQKLSNHPIHLGQEPLFQTYQGTEKIKHFATRYKNFISNLYLGEIQGIPVILGQPLAKHNEMPDWTYDLAQTYKSWTTMNSDLPFVIGQDPNGDFRIVYPLFKIMTPFKGDRISINIWSNINSSLIQLQHAFLGDPRFRVSWDVNNKLGIMLSHQFLLADFGHFGFRFSHFTRSKTEILQRGGKFFDPVRQGDDFSYFNIIRAHLMTWMSHEQRALALNNLIDNNQFNDWFETVFWLSHKQIIFSQKLDFNDYNSVNYQVLSGKSARVKAQSWFNDRSLKRHFEKHGQPEMGFGSADDYLSSALDFFNSESSAQIAIKRLNSDTKVKYDFNTKEFGVVNADGKIITYYRLTESYRPPIEFHDYIGTDIISR